MFPWYILGGSSGTIPPGSFSPSSISGLTLWLDGQDSSSITLDGSNNVSQWNDKSGGARNAVQATTTQRPSLSTINGVQALNFDGTDDRLTITYTGALDLASYTIFGVVDNDSTSGFRAWLEKATDGGATNRKYWFGASGTAGGYVVNEVAVLSTEGGTIELKSGAARTTPVTLSLVKNGTTDAKLYIDGSLSQTDAVISTQNNNMDTTIGGRYYPWLGKIGEILIYDSALSDTNRAAVEAYLKAKWGTP